MARIVAIANQKGGVGKTTTSVNLAACLAAMAYRTLLIDLDPQGNATSGVGIDRAEMKASIYEVLSGEVSVEDAAMPTSVEQLRVLGTGSELAGAEVELVDVEDRELVLKRALEGAVDYDYVVIDCPPSLSLLTINALVASNSILIPVQTEYYALEGLARLLDTIELVKSELNPLLEIEGLLLTMHDARNNLSRQVEGEVRAHFGDLAYNVVIPRNVRLSEAPSFGEPILMYDISSKGAKSYLTLAKEFVERDTARQNGVVFARPGEGNDGL